MIVLEKTAKTVEDAINLALLELDTTIDQVDYEILESGSKGLLGIGAKEAKVRVSMAYDVNKCVIDFLKPIFASLNIDPQYEVIEKDEVTWFAFSGRNLGSLIGRRGETLDALQYLVCLAVNRKFAEKKKIVLDVEGYRASREETLANLAQKMAEKVRKSSRDVVLEPMSPHERRIIHMTLQDSKFVTTASEGNEPYRKVIIRKKGGYHRS